MESIPTISLGTHGAFLVAKSALLIIVEPLIKDTPNKGHNRTNLSQKGHILRSQMSLPPKRGQPLYKYKMPGPQRFHFSEVALYISAFYTLIFVYMFLSTILQGNTKAREGNNYFKAYFQAKSNTIFQRERGV